ncbi:outer membrane beta-barrel protein [Chitinophaga ginsengisoli]|uniref:Outer membrane protein with beta-barrel domain n=1 Tax=Chitinophaga ginsengisoli TaxID=363837 RepID=A0A2P8GAC9_9BACT|nr:outer membrane beta-barrel protein [Chitinophaga ginsengisoli]PSL30913.1 outer membrane protein with beta-barrel domain [Chitinophaga ginsengisoli]
MKKLILLSLLAISMLPVFAQTSIGVIGGYNLAWRYPIGPQQDANHDYSLKPRWRAGLVTDHHLWKKLYLQPQLLLNTKGLHEKISSIGAPDRFDYSTERDLRVLYLEIQANFLLKERLGHGKVFLGAGPYLARGITGRSKAKGFSSLGGQRTDYDMQVPVKFSNNVVYNTPNVYEKHYDAGINFLAGYELKNGLFFNAVYSRGLKNLYYDDSYKSKNTYVGLSVGYFFKRFD